METDLLFNIDDIQLFGMRRSGNHAIISWILPHFKGRPIRHFNQTHISPEGNLQGIKDQMTLQDGNGEPLILMSFEDQAIDPIPGQNWLTKRPVLLLRDPFNMFASRLKRVRELKGTMHEGANAVNDYTINLWKQYAKEFLKETDYLGSHLIRVNFNRWVSDDNYRKSLSKHFGQFTDEGFGHISEFTHGSSFDSYEYQDHAQEMDLLNRWKTLENDEEYLALFDEETIELSNRIFGEICPIKPAVHPSKKALVEKALRTAHLLDKALKHKRAIGILEQALKIDPDNKTVKNNLANIRLSVNPEATLKELLEELKEDPNSPEILCNLSTTYNALRQFDKAIEYGEKALLAHNCPELKNHLGYQYHCSGEFNKSIKIFQEAIQERDEATIWLNLGNTYLGNKQPAHAIDAYHQALRKKDKDAPGVHTNLAFAYYMLGAEDLWAREYENRIKTFNVMKAYTTLYGEPWDGHSSLEGKNVLIYCEQGFGDAIQFIRFIPIFKEKFNCRITLNTDECLIPILRNCKGVDECVSLEQTRLEKKMPPFDAHVPIISLCYHTKCYQTEQRKYIHWDKKTDLGEGFKIGIAWKGNPKHPCNHHRSCDPELFRQLQLPGVRLFSLEKNNEDVDLESMEIEKVELNNFGDTATIINSLDLIVSVDTAVVHLAGAMERPVWALLAYSNDWRWKLNGPHTDWYKFVRLFRQPAPKAWDYVFADVRDRITSTLAQG